MTTYLSIVLYKALFNLLAFFCALERASWMFIPLDVINTVCFVVVPKKDKDSRINYSAKTKRLSSETIIIQEELHYFRNNCNWLPVTWTLANLKLVLTQTKVDFRWIFFHTFAEIFFSETRTLNNLNLSLTRSNFPSDHLYIGF